MYSPGGQKEREIFSPDQVNLPHPAGHPSCQNIAAIIELN